MKKREERLDSTDFGKYTSAKPQLTPLYYFLFIA